MSRKSAIPSIIFLILCTTRVEAQSAPARTVLDGVYSDAQVARGRAAFVSYCAICHGGDFQGISAPTLTGDKFIEHWREDWLDTFYNYIKEYMPRGRPQSANPIPAQEYLDIVTYIMKGNGYRTGSSELTTDLIGQVMLVGKNGPQPVPDQSLIVVLGCLSRTPNGGWLVSNATEPVRTRIPDMTTPAELKSASQRSLGSLSFRLTDLEAVPDFVPGDHEGHKMYVKGYLTRQPNAERISLTAMDMLDSACSAK